jgi:DNA-binding CsgD family transcriptional regulator
MAVTGGEEPIGIHVLTGGRALTPEEIALVRDLEALTARQRDVLALLSQGVPAKLIALRLGLAERTVRNYIREILMLLRCNSQLEALAKLGPLNPRLVADSLDDANAAAH